MTSNFLLRNAGVVFRNRPDAKTLQKTAMSLFILLLSCFTAYAQSVVTGTVTDKENTTLIGVTVSVEGKSVRTLTDANGKYAINVPADGKKLTFSYVGMQTLTMDIDGKKVLNAVLSSGNELSEVTVVGYGSVKKSDLTGAVATISAKDFNKGPLIAPDQLMQGKVAGVQMINNSGQPGGATTVKIRGNTAVTGSGQPLYVVDGVALSGNSARPSSSPATVGGVKATPGGGLGAAPGGNPLSFINPSDIATMEILKDASATAIYGSRAAFGVVLITTKRGASGAMKLDVNASTGVSNIMNQLDVLDGDEYRSALSKYGLTSGDYGSNVNAMDAIMRTAYNQNYSVGLSGGNDASTYRASFGYQDQQGIIRKTDLKKYTASFNGNFKFLDSKKLGMDVTMISSQYNENIAPITNDAGFTGSLISQALTWNPTRPLRNPDGSLFIENGRIINPLAMSEAYSDKSKVSSILGSISPYYKITPWLEYRMLVSLNYSSGVRRNSTRSFINIEGVQAKPADNFPGGYASYSNSEILTHQFTNTLNFNKEIAPKLNLNAIIGYEYTNNANKGTNMNATGFGDIPVDYTDALQATPPNNRRMSSFNDPTYELQSYFARAIFNYAGKYLLTATVRADGSTRFGSKNRYGYFPSFSAAWNIKNEDFMANVEWLDQLKIRAGYGRTGNQEFPSGSSQQRYAYVYEGTGTALKPINNDNPDLKWQSDEQMNIGADFGFFKGKITGSIDVFRKKTTDLLFPQSPQQPTAADGSVTWGNLPGYILNKGVEITLNGNIIDRTDFSWSLGGNATFLNNKVKDFSTRLINTGALNGQGLSDVNIEVIKEGLPLFAMVTRKYEGLNADGFSQYTDDGYTYYYVGNPNPSLILGISTDFRYKKLSLGLNFNGSFGQDIYNNTANSVLPITNLGTRNIASALLNSSIKESLANPIAASSRYIEKGNYLKLANATINYNVGNIGRTIKGLNVYINGQNLLVMTKYSGFDPEVNTDKSINGVPSMGIEYVPFPSARTFNFGVNFSL
jgi:TonB-linked SusC/RagA family outer membrane protein